MRRGVAVVLVCAPAGLGLLALWAARGAEIATVTADGEGTEPPAPLAPAIAVAAGRTPVATSLPDPCASFPVLVDRLVDLGTAQLAAIEGKRLAEAEELDGRCRSALDEIFRCVANPDERALFALTGLLSEDTTVAGRVRRRAYLLLVEKGLESRLRRDDAGDRRALDGLVASMLATLPRDERLAADLSALLEDRPYLAPAHEDQVLQVAALAADLPFLVPVARDLLLTLWRNLQRSGERSGAELASLALLFTDDANPGRRMAALQHLLQAEGGRFRAFVLDEVVRSGDADLAREVAMSAAGRLEPDEAVAALVRLQPVGGAMTGPFIVLGQRDPATLRDAYLSLLADDRSPEVRAELVTGVGFRRDGAGVELAETAFAHDEDRRVRSRALFVLTAQAAADRGERALMEALDDPGLGGDPRALGEAVLALENLAFRGEVNAVDRVARRLEACPALSPADRQRLRGILRRTLPGGGRRP